MHRGSAYILLGRWIDSNDHMYIENLAVDEKQCPHFCQRFGEVYLFWSSALKKSGLVIAGRWWAGPGLGPSNFYMMGRGPAQPVNF